MDSVQGGSVTFNGNSVLSAGGQTFALSALISVNGGQTPPPTLAIRAYDRDAYSGVQSYDYGNFTSPHGGTISAGTQYRPTTLYFDYVNGQYVSRDSGDALSAFHFTSSQQNYRSVYLSLFTSDSAGTSFNGNWIDPSWQHLSDLNIVTRSDYIDPTPNVATPQEIAAIAKSFIGKVWDSDGCWILTSNISTAAGASLPVASAKLDPGAITGNGQWQVLFNGAKQTGDWRALLQTGDIVEMGMLGGKAHIATVTSGSGHGAMWVDNSGVSANDGTATDIIIQGEHLVDEATTRAISDTVVIFRLAPASSTPAAPIPMDMAPPLVTAHAQSLHTGNSLSVASLFAVTDPNLLPMVAYQIIDQSGIDHIALNGARNLATAAQKAAGAVIVDAVDLPKLTFVASVLGEANLVITAFDGQNWGSANVTVTSWRDPAATVAGSSQSLHATQQLVPASDYFSASDAYGNQITQYRFIDVGHTGQLFLRNPKANLAGNNEAAQGIVRVAAADLADVQFRVLPGTANFAVSAFDGVQWSAYASVTLAGQNNAPAITALPRQTIAVDQPVAVASMFTLADADQDAVTMVSIYDYYGNIQLNGAKDYCPDPHAYQVTLADLAKVTYTAPNVMGGLQGFSVFAYDGTSWSAPTGITFTISDPHPVVAPASQSRVALGQSVSLGTLFTAVDPNHGVITGYTLQSPAGGGDILLNGATDLANAAQHAAGIMQISAADLDKVGYRAGDTVGGESLHIAATNGSLWGAADVLVYSVDNTSPSVRALNQIFDLGQSVPLTDVMQAASPSGAPITQYRIQDPAGGGALMLNGAANLATPAPLTEGIALVAAADIGRLVYLAADSESTEVLSVSAFDGESWGQADILVTNKNFHRPVVTAIPVTAHAGQVLSLQDLFKVSDADGHAIMGFQINDVGQHLQLNGAVNIYATQQYQGYYGISAADLAKVTYVVGGPGTTSIGIEANDGTYYSTMVTETITVLPNPVVEATAVTVGARQTVALSSLFVATNPSGKPIIQYLIQDPSGAGSVQQNDAQNLASAAQQAQGMLLVAAADLARLSYLGGAAYGVDTLQISANDGDSWGLGAVAVTTIDGTPAAIDAKPAKVETNATVALGTLFGATSHSGHPIVEYKFTDPLGGGKLVLNGAANLATKEQQAQQGISIVAAADLAKLEYVGAERPGSESLTVAAFDGQSWSSADLTIASLQSAKPVVAAQTVSLTPGQSVKLASMFAVTMPDGHPISAYIVKDPGHHIQLNGAVNLYAQQEGAGYYWVSGSDIDKVTFLAGDPGVSQVSVIVSDGLTYGNWTEERIIVGQDSLFLPPAIMAATTTVSLGQSVALASLFTVTDPTGHSISQFSVYDTEGGGKVLRNGVANLATEAQQHDGILVVAAADLASLQYQAASSGGAETLRIGANDGVAWGYADLAITSALLPPTITALDTAVELQQSLYFKDIFSVATHSAAVIGQYEVQDPGGGGLIALNGAQNLASAAQAAQGISIVAAQDLDKLTYRAADTLGSETLLIGVNDGSAWSSVNIAVATTDNRPPVITQTGTMVDLGQKIFLSNLFGASSPSGKPIIDYKIEDPVGGGKLLLNTAHDLANPAQRAQGVSVVAAYDLGALLYQAGDAIGSETLRVSAFDGNSWTSADIALSSVTLVLPVVTPKPITMTLGSTVSFASMFTIEEGNVYATKRFFILDAAQGIVLNGAANLAESPYYDYHGHYDILVQDFQKLQYSADHLGTVTIGIQAYDGQNASNYVEETITIVGAPPVGP